jgi:hypothetical protein
VATGAVVKSGVLKVIKIINAPKKWKKKRKKSY